MPEDTKQDKTSRDNLALIIGVIFLMGLVFAAYTYFNQGSVQDKIKRNADKVEDIISSNTKRDDETTEAEKTEDEVSVENRNETIGNGTATGIGGITAVWIANDYKEGDISGKSYTVVSGDTLWEIAEAVYGNGAEWGKLLQANSDDIGFLPNGSQALIFPGQVLNLP